VKNIIMDMLKRVKTMAKNIRVIWCTTLLSYPKRVQCNVCGWRGRRFKSDIWHKYLNCPKCCASVRQRLFVAALQQIDEVSLEKLIKNKKILHFAPEKIISSLLRKEAASYITADFLKADCDLKLNMSNMAEIEDEEYDIVIAFDVLEHVPSYQKALEEVYRILSPKGYGIFTVPQEDDLVKTFEDPGIVTPKGRLEAYGQSDHLRLFGADFSNILANKGFSVTAIDESNFPVEIVKKYTLFPPVLSMQPMATNYRKVFFAQKIGNK